MISQEAFDNLIDAICKLDTDTDKFALGEPATQVGTDSFNREYQIGDILVTLANGDILCIPAKSDPVVDTDTFAEASPATEAGTDSFGNTYNIGDTLVTLANGDVVAIKTSTSNISPLNCSGTAISGQYKPLTVEQSHAPYIITQDPVSCGALASCRPAAPDCPIDGMKTHTYNEHGSIEWVWFNGAWIDINYSSDTKVVCDFQGTVDLWDSSNGSANPDANLQTAINTNLADPLSVTIENTDCYPWYVEYKIRSAFNSQLRQGWRFTLGFANADDYDTNLTDQCLDGVLVYAQGYSPSDGTGFIRSGVQGLTRTLKGKLAPGQTSTFSQVLRMFLLTEGDANINNLISAGSTTLSGTYTRCKG